MIGDSRYDMQMAANAGMDAIGITHGVHDADALREHSPIYCVDDLYELDQRLREDARPMTAMADL